MTATIAYRELARLADVRLELKGTARVVRDMPKHCIWRRTIADLLWQNRRHMQRAQRLAC